MAKLKEAKVTGEPGWFWRRIMVFGLVAFACWRLASMEGGADSRLNDGISWFWFVIILMVALSYTGLATVQDVIAIWRTRSGLPYSPQTEVTPETGDTVIVNHNATGSVQQVETGVVDQRVG